MRASSSSSAANATSAPWQMSRSVKPPSGATSHRSATDRGRHWRPSGTKLVPSQPSASRTGELQHPRRQRRGVDRDGSTGRLASRIGRAPGQRDVVQRTVEVDLVARTRSSDDLDGLAHPRQRPVERDAVQTLEHLRPRAAEPEQEPSLGQVLQRHRCHRDRDRRARTDLHDTGPEQQPRGTRSEIAERRDGVGAPRLGHPADVESKDVRLRRRSRLSPASRYRTRRLSPYASRRLCALLDRFEVRAHPAAELCHPIGDDALFLVRHAIDRR